VLLDLHNVSLKLFTIFFEENDKICAQGYGKDSFDDVYMLPAIFVHDLPV
jgi:hypothetical protein